MYLNHFPPMGVYETLFKFQDVTKLYMGDHGTRPWVQGFPLTTQLPNGPAMPTSISFDSLDLKYPAAAGVQPLRKAIADYYNHFYGSKIDEDNVAVFAGGRPAIFATLMFLQSDVKVMIEETEYTPYYDKLKMLQRDHVIIPSNPANRFRPSLNDYETARSSFKERALLIKSNPCNPTGVTWSGEELRRAVGFAEQPGNGAIFDEAYEFFHSEGPVSAMSYVKDIEQSNLFVIGAATKGLQAPGLRTGWVVASKKHIEIFRNFSSIAMGGVSRPSQICVSELLNLARVEKARNAVVSFYNEQRERYRDALSKCGFELCTGDGGFYHWGKLPNSLTADVFNQRLFKHKAAILPGTLCDMHRRNEDGPHAKFIRFSFGPLAPETFGENMQIIETCLKG